MIILVNVDRGTIMSIGAGDARPRCRGSDLAMTKMGANQTDAIDELDLDKHLNSDYTCTRSIP